MQMQVDFRLDQEPSSLKLNENQSFYELQDLLFKREREREKLVLFRFTI